MLKRSDRRDDARIPLEIFLNTYVAERPHRAVRTNISPAGLYVSRLEAPTRHGTFMREDRYVQLEFTLPGTSDSIWARGEIRYDELTLPGSMVHGTGIFLRDLARGHKRLIEDYVHQHTVERRRQRLTQILQLIRKNRYQ